MNLSRMLGQDSSIPRNDWVMTIRRDMQYLQDTAVLHHPVHQIYPVTIT